MEMIKPIKGMCPLEFFQFFNAKERKELKSFPNVTKMTATELEKEFWDIQAKFDNDFSIEFAEGREGQLLVFRQQLLNEFFEKLTGKSIV